MKCRRALPLVSVVAIPWSVALSDEPFIQADVYDVLYHAYVECDSEFPQSRSEFITEKLEHDAGRISMASLVMILRYNIEVANQEIAAMRAERESRVSDSSGPKDQSANQAGEWSEEDKEAHKRVREIDALLREKRQYVELHECLLEAL